MRSCLALLLGVAAVAGGWRLSADAGATPTSSVTATRFGGTNRYDTARLLAEASFPAGTTNAVVVSGTSYTDGMAASYLASSIGDGAPVLLTDPASLPTATEEALTHLGVTTVTIVGGVNAVGDAVAEQIAALAAPGGAGGHVTVQRVGGADRYATAALVAAAAGSGRVGILDGVKTAIVVSGAGFVDGLVAGSMAYGAHFPVVLTAAGELPDASAQELRSLGIGHVIMVGGEDAISTPVQEAIQGLGAPAITTARLAGANRFDTAAKVATFEVSALGFTPAKVVVAYGLTFPDLLAAGPYSGRTREPLLLTDPLPPETLAAIQTIAGMHASPGGSFFDIVGGAGVIGDGDVQAMITAADDANGGSTTTPPASEVTSPTGGIPNPGGSSGGSSGGGTTSTPPPTTTSTSTSIAPTSTTSIASTTTSSPSSTTTSSPSSTTTTSSTSTTGPSSTTTSTSTTSTTQAPTSGFVGVRQIGATWTALGPPFGVASDGAGHVWVSDGIHHLVRELDAAGNTIVALDGHEAGATAFADPMGVAIDRTNGDVWVSDPGAHDVQGFAPDGTHLHTLTGTQALPLSTPDGLALDGTGHVFVADVGNNLVREFATSGAELFQFTGGTTPFASPLGVAVDPSSGHVFVADSGHNLVRSFDGAGTALATLDGNETGATPLSAPSDVALDAGGDVWVADSGNALIQEFDSTGAYLRRIDGTTSGDTPLLAPTGIQVDNTGTLWVADTGNGLVHSYGATGLLISVLDGGPSTLAQPRGVAIEGNGDLRVADTGNQEVDRFDPQGTIVSSFDGTDPTDDPLSQPSAVAVTAGGNVWVADPGEGIVREFSASGTQLMEIDGTANGGLSFQQPSGVAVDAAGNLWVADTGNSEVREFSPLGVPLTTLTGNETGATFLFNPQGVAIDPVTGHVWVTDGEANVVEAFSPSDVWLQTIDGHETGATPFAAPAGLTVDGSGNIWVADTGNNLVQEFSPVGTWLVTLDGLESGARAFSAPGGVAVDGSGNVWVADTGNNSIQELAPSAAQQLVARRTVILDRKRTGVPAAVPVALFVLGGALIGGVLVRGLRRPGWDKRRVGSACVVVTVVAGTLAAVGVSQPRASAQATGPPAEVQFTGSASYVAQQWDPAQTPRSTLIYQGAAKWKIVYELDPQTGAYTADPNRSSVTGTRTKFFTGPGGSVLCSGPATLNRQSDINYSLRLDPNQPMDSVGLPLPTDLLFACDTAGGPIQSPFSPPVGGPIPGFPHGFTATFPSTLLTQGGSKVLWTFPGCPCTGRSTQHVQQDGSTRIDTDTWKISAQLSGVAPGAYVAMGDSFSSGSGAPPYDPASGGCDRSPQSYGALYDQRLPKNTLFVACSGAPLAAIDNTFQGEPPQITAIPTSAEVVSITIGGNDTGLFTMLELCVAGGIVATCSTALGAGAVRRVQGVEPGIQAALAEIKAAAPNAKVAILSYPNSMPAVNGACDGLQNPVLTFLQINPNDVAYLHGLLDTLNTAVRNAASGAGVLFVDNTAAFAGHDVCSADDWFGPLTGGPETLHPTASGNIAMKNDLTNVVGLP